MATNNKKYPKKSNKKKLYNNTVHPHIEYIQNEINSLQEQVNSMQELEITKELTAEEKVNKLVLKSCIERYKETLKKLTDSTMASKLHSYTSSLENLVKLKGENRTLLLLQFLYMMRLGQLGLFDLITVHLPTAATLLASITDLTDQIVGASVYYAKDNSNLQKRKQVFGLLNKLDQGIDEVINESINKEATYKQVKDTLLAIWENTTSIENIDNSQEIQYAVLSFDSMMSTAETTTTGTAMDIINKEEGKVSDEGKVNGEKEGIIMEKDVDVKEEKVSEATASIEPDSWDNITTNDDSNKPWNHIEDIKSAALNSGTWDKNKSPAWNKTKSRSRENKTKSSSPSPLNRKKKSSSSNEKNDSSPSDGKERPDNDSTSWDDIKKELAAESTIWDDANKELSTTEPSSWVNDKKKPTIETTAWADKKKEFATESTYWEDKKKELSSWNNKKNNSSWNSEEKDSSSKDNADKDSNSKNDDTQGESWRKFEESTKNNNSTDKHGWTTSYDINVKVDTWGNTDSTALNTLVEACQSKSIIPEQVNDPAVAFVEKDVKHDDWRRRDNDTTARSRGRGRGNRRGQGGPNNRDVGTGRGKGKGRGRGRGDNDYNRSYD